VVARQDPRGSSDAREAANASSNDGLGSERCLHHSSTARVGARPDQPSPTSGGRRRGSHPVGPELKRVAPLVAGGDVGGAAPAGDGLTAALRALDRACRRFPRPSPVLSRAS
jgi:hypothetical protein